MAQGFTPENKHEREQLQSSVSEPEISLEPREEEQPSARRVGGVDVLLALVILGAVTLLVMAASHWTAPLAPTVQIQLSPLMLPIYAGYSLLRMLLAYLL